MKLGVEVGEGFNEFGVEGADVSEIWMINLVIEFFQIGETPGHGRGSRFEAGEDKGHFQLIIVERRFVGCDVCED